MHAIYPESRRKKGEVPGKLLNCYLVSPTSRTLKEEGPEVVGPPRDWVGRQSSRLLEDRHKCFRMQPLHIWKSFGPGRETRNRKQYAVYL